MKKITLLAAVILAFATTANASEIINFSGENTKTHFSFDEPIVFTERGVEFYIFPNGEFDFNTVSTTGGSGTYYKNGRRNTTYDAPAGVQIEHDNAGRIRRIGNVFMNYDRNNRIKRIGTVYMTYNRFALAQVGNLRIFYNRNGQVTNMTGSVKYQNNYSYSYKGSNNSSSQQTYYKSGTTED